MIYFNKFYEVQKHLAITRHIYNNMIHTVSAATWKKLDPAQQVIFREESAAAGDLMRKLIADDEAEQIRKVEAAGMQVTRPDLAPFRALMGPAYTRIAAYAGEANVKKFREMAEAGPQRLRLIGFSARSERDDRNDCDRTAARGAAKSVPARRQDRAGAGRSLRHRKGVRRGAGSAWRDRDLCGQAQGGRGSHRCGDRSTQPCGSPRGGCGQRRCHRRAGGNN